MELMAINLHRPLLNSTNGGVHMHHGLNSTETLKIVCFIAVFLGPFLIVLFRLYSCAAKVVKALLSTDGGDELVAQVAASRAERVRMVVAAAEAAAVQAAESAAVEARLKKHEMRLLLAAIYRLDRDGAGCECTICLDDFVDGEMVRVLPCSHRFHVRCIDEWLVSQVSCPNCRISLFQHVINI